MARILVIDDDPELRTVLEQMLKSAGHEVILAADGKEGVKQFHVTPADLVITDLLMPNQEGMETIIDLRRSFPTVAIIAMTGASYSTVLLDVARRIGAVRTMEKPFQSHELLTAIEEALRR